ncbi:LysM peptidoglycan-binding domain-containing protein [Xanthomonas populi]|uniref:Peptidoglycan-binding protein LysM n=1 Tax=Xanthomonas populi TaxID=53414 RepID=A0A2S7EC92_9XANT|nr:LysM peptidoglycan-binding domain-containing protein [Xanthomonas populi]PPU87795.1 peptidoglycan-binding protein LysM [Xanthomonas populi]
MSVGKKADFSGVTSSLDSAADITPAPNFSNVRTSVQNTAQIVEETVTVQAGDGLPSIATRPDGDGNLWPRIFEANRDTLRDLDKIFPGQVLHLPPKA